MVKIKNNSLTHLETVDKAAIKLRKLIEDTAAQLKESIGKAEDIMFILKDALNKAIKEKENYDRENTK